MNAFSHWTARLILRGREAAAHQIYNRVSKQQKFYLWTAQHLYVHAGYPLPAILERAAHDNSWMQEIWVPSPALTAFDNRAGGPELPLFAASHAPPHVLAEA